MNNARTMEHGYMIHRYNTIVSSIEYEGGLTVLSKNEQDEYNRLREYFKLYDQLIKSDMSETDAHDIACVITENVI